MLTTLCLLGGMATSLAAAESETAPNVILIMTDDQGIGDFGVMNNPVIETPNIDALARDSVSFDNFYVSPVCSPTRACLMTGRYNYRTRCIDTYLGRSMMDPEEVTVAEALSKAGYATGIFGKWHLGDCYPMRPNDQGFQESLIHRGGGLAQPSEPRENDRRYTDPILFHNGEEVKTKGYCTDVYFDAAMKFMKREHDQHRPFFAYLATNAPHGPFHDVPEDLREHYAKKDMNQIAIAKRKGKGSQAEADKLARIAAMITNVDQNVGRLMKELENLGIADNTIVIYMVDNGPNSRRYVGDLRGNKGGVNEGGIRSPLWVHWPARLEGGTAREQLAAHIDIMPTILEACGVTPSSDHRMDGRSLLPVLLDKDADWPERTIVIQSHRGDEPKRYHHFMIRDDRWKLVHPSGFGRESFAGDPKFELYDLADDPGEKRNLHKQKPQVVARLKEAYDKWFDDVSSTRPDNYAPPRIHVGSPKENPTVLTRQDWRGGTWAANSIGHWELYVEKPGSYDVTLLFDPSDQPETATVTIGDDTREATVKPGQRTCVIRDVLFPGGKAQLEAVLRGGKEARGVYQASVERGA
ncbi:arylsulfatase [Kolteria novifilia]